MMHVPINIRSEVMLIKMYGTKRICFHRFVHGTCDVDADLATYNRKKESNPDYVYMCLSCKQRTQSGREMLPRRKDSKLCNWSAILDVQYS